MLITPKIISPGSILYSASWIFNSYLKLHIFNQTMYLISIPTIYSFTDYSISLNSNSTFPTAQVKNLRTVFNSFLSFSTSILEQVLPSSPLKHIQNPTASHHLHLDHPVQISIISSLTPKTSASLGLMLPLQSPYTQFFYKPSGSMLS